MLLARSCLMLFALLLGIPGLARAQASRSLSPDNRPPSQQPLPELSPPAPLPPPEQLLPAPATPDSGGSTETLPTTLVVNRYRIVGSTVFSAAELEQATRAYTTASLGREVSFTEVLQARSAVTRLYEQAGYVTSGAIIPPQKVVDGVVVIQVLEGRLAEINVSGTRRLHPAYVRARLALAAQPPLNQNRLLEALQLLQNNPLIQTIAADLQAGIRPGTNILEVKVTEADSFRGQIVLDNGRSPSVGSFRRQAILNEANLLGLGDALSISYTNTAGSNGIDASYTLPLNARNGTLSLAFGNSRSRVIEKPFDVLDITAKSRYYEITLRQPIVVTPREELALGITLSHQTNQTFLGITDIGPFPLSAGADDLGRTRTSAFRVFQEWSKRSSQQVLAFRSQFSVGMNLLGATINDSGPDSRFFNWRGQGQWLRLLAPDTLLLLRTDIQFSDRPLLGLEQFGLGGQSSVRGYRQDYLLTDNGLLASLEARIPLLRVPRLRGLLQVTPFVDFGNGWNNAGSNPDPQTIASTGLGLLWRQGDNLSARLDWGIPFVSIGSRGKTWQEQGVYFSIVYTPF